MTCPVVILKQEGKKKKTSYHAACGLPSAMYEVAGQSFTCRQEMCWVHAKKAEESGFKVRKLVPAEVTQ